MFPETGGRTLEELAFLFEKEELRQEAAERTVATEKTIDRNLHEGVSVGKLSSEEPRKSGHTKTEEVVV